MRWYSDFSVFWNLKNLFWDIWGDITYPFRQFYKICQWLPLIWNDVDWDSCALWQVMEFKLRRMESCIRNGHHLHRERDADQIFEAANLCQRMGNEIYFNLWYDHENEERKANLMPTLKIWQLPSGDFNACCYEDYMFKQDLERFNLIMTKYVRNWWD